jgi:sugar lactone lactonase YvrE
MFTLCTTLLICLASFSGCSRFETEAHQQAAPPPPTLKFIGQWGAKGNGPGQLDEPAGIATDAVGNAYISDGGSQFIHKFDPSGTPLLSFQEGPLKHPQGIAIDSGGAMYVSDAIRNSVFIFLPNGDKYRELHLRPHQSPENEISMAIGDDGLIHILDYAADKAFTFTPNFRLTQTWQPSTSARGTNHRLGPMAGGPDGSLFLADVSGGRFVRFSRDGQFVSSIDASGDGTSRRLSREFAVSSACVFAMDADGHNIHVWTLDGQLKLEADLATELGAGSRLPPALAASPRGELLVLDAPQSHVLRYHINF